MNRYRRDLLRKLIEAGQIEAKTSYSYDGRVVTDIHTPGNDWKPARLSTGYGDWKDGYFNFHSAWFTSKTGWAVQEAEHIWELHFADESVLLRRIG